MNPPKRVLCSLLSLAHNSPSNPSLTLPRSTLPRSTLPRSPLPRSTPPRRSTRTRSSGYTLNARSSRSSAQAQELKLPTSTLLRAHVAKNEQEEPLLLSEAEYQAAKADSLLAHDDVAGMYRI